MPGMKRIYFWSSLYSQLEAEMLRLGNASRCGGSICSRSESDVVSELERVGGVM